MLPILDLRFIGPIISDIGLNLNIAPYITRTAVLQQISDSKSRSALQAGTNSRYLIRSNFFPVFLTISITAYSSSAYFSADSNDGLSSVYYKRSPGYKMSVYGKRAVDEISGIADPLEYDWIF